ncbi:MAG: hypothetical protein NWE81_02250, partial [Candidatus Bathyarchaeota archaeon]|nr:hypothetical protein [Candidatus Bathyarchaeota archaeon]
ISDSSNLTIVHNNFINNTQQAVMDDAELISWDDGVEGNYWDNCVGVDLEVGGDGVGDTPHTIDVNNTDTHPLMGPIRFFDAGTWNGNPYWIHTTSNSTISDFHFSASQKMASFNVSGVSPNTTGFCRVAIPKDLLWAEEPSWVVSVNGSIVSVRAQVYTNLTYLYFTYNHSIQNVRIYGTEVIPEFSTLPILSILAILTLSVVGLNATLHKGRNTKGEDFPAFERVEQERAKSTYTQHKEC